MGAPSAPTLNHLSYDARWRELCEHVRTTDDISFKLLGLVPLISVAGIAAALLKADSKSTPLVALLAFFAAVVTLAFWRWERKNIQMCIWLRKRAADLERCAVGASMAGHFYAFPETGPAAHGKRDAERVIYGSTIAAWLLLPAAISISDPAASLSPRFAIGGGLYVILAVWFGVVARQDLRKTIDAKPELTEETQSQKQARPSPENSALPPR